MKKIIILGNGSMAMCVYYFFKDNTHVQVEAFTVDSDIIENNLFFNLPVVPLIEVKKIYPPEDYNMFVAIGYLQQNEIREQKFLEAKQLGYKLVNIIHPKSAICSDLIVGENCFISSNVSIQPQVVIKNNVFIRENCNIGHDTFIEDNCYIGGSTSISGNVKIGRNVFTGKNATIREGLHIGANCIIGAGVTMLESSKPNEVFIAPKPIKFPFESKGLL